MRIMHPHDFAELLPHTPVVFLLFGGDRLSCCDEAVVLEADGAVIGGATIAPDGESGNGIPDIVGLFVFPEHRRQGHGTAILAAALKRCRTRGFSRVRVVTLSTGAKRAVEGLPSDLRAMLEVKDGGNVLDSFG